ncbi:MAG: zincin-like metallopeptidase domain-containing protein [Flavihumibacter sp.]|jgi:antirestriction protein ArdC|nr:zincin-like metallopeptidase domain-containing protein [Flavihumibacter sp.]
MKLTTVNIILFCFLILLVGYVIYDYNKEKPLNGRKKKSGNKSPGNIRIEFNQITNYFQGLEIISVEREALEGLNGDYKNAYEVIKEKIFEAIDHHGKEWVKAWACSKRVGPMNYKTRHRYSGINSFFLGSYLLYKHEINPYFLTYKQAQEMGGNVKKGAKGLNIFYWSDAGKGKKDVPQPDEKGEMIVVQKEYRYAFLKSYYVFHASDIEGINWKDLEQYKPKVRSDAERIETAEAIVDGMPQKPAIVFEDSDRAYYAQLTDKINMPKIEQFTSDQEYYGTLFHELIHATGHPSRLNREKGKTFGDPAYAFEELVAEIGAAFLCGEAGILNFTFENSTAYVKGWQDALKEHMNEDKNFVVRAARRSEEAADFILNRKTVEDEA